MVGATDSKWILGAFSALVAIFDRVGLQTNDDKKVSMAYTARSAVLYSIQHAVLY